MLWCLIKRGKSMLDATAEDCHAYMEFVANLPDAWISPTKVARLAPGWAPFNKAPTFTSRHQSFAALHSLFAWLVQRRSRASNPWATCDSKSLGHAKAVFAELQGFAEVTVTGRVDEAAIARFRRDVLGHLLNHDTHGIVVDLRAAEIAIDTDSMPLGNVDPAYRRVGSRPVAVVTTAQSEALFIKWAWFMQYVSGMAGRPAARARRGRNSGSS
jgi:hypothetical protein